MVHINRFIDKVSIQESKKSKDVVLPMDEARGLRDEISKLLASVVEQNEDKKEEVVNIEIRGRGFK
jgi:hypothetical protein